MQKTTTLLADEPQFSYQELIDFGQFEYLSANSDYSSVKSKYTPTKPKIIEAEIDEVSMNPTDEFYTLEELQQLEDKSMAYMDAKFKHINFRRNPRYNKACRSKFQGKSGYSGSGTRSRSVAAVLN